MQAIRVKKAMYLKENRKGFMEIWKEKEERRNIIISKIKINLKINNNKNKKFCSEECIGTGLHVEQQVFLYVKKSQVDQVIPGIFLNVCAWETG